MKIALAQMEVIPGMPKRNLEAMLEMIEEAKRKSVHLVAFPEMCVGGYLLGDNVWNANAFCRDLMHYNNSLREASDGIAIAYGNVYLDENINEKVNDRIYHPNEDGRTRKYNAVYIFQNRKPAKRINETPLLPAGVQPKTLLPNYRMFDDKRYFHSIIQIAQDFGSPLETLIQPHLIEVDGEKIPVGFELCEDLWCEDYRRDAGALNPTKMLIENGARVIVNLSASPWTFGKNGARDRRVQFLKRDSGNAFVPFLYVNCTGVQNNGKNLVTFDGGSTVYNRDGDPIILSLTPYKKEIIVVEEKDFSHPPVERKEKPRIEQEYEALIAGLRHTRDIRGVEEHPRIVIGLSGGIDSALVAALARDAFGFEKVLGINMPTRYNSGKTRDAAEHVARMLGIQYEVIPIEDLVNMNATLLRKYDLAPEKMHPNDIGNIMAKIRSTNILSNIAAINRAMYTSNGNKVEIFFGYATLDGDARGHIAPLGDLTKTEVVAMAKWYNEKEGREVIPEELFPERLWRFESGKIAPTAELEENQKDPMLFGYHCNLISLLMDFKRHTPVEVMQHYLEGTLDSLLDRYHEGLVGDPYGLTYELMERYGITKPENFLKDLEWVDRSFQNMVFKRVQGIPLIIISKNAFGYDNRESMLPYWPLKEAETLKEKILKIDCYKPK